MRKARGREEQAMVQVSYTLSEILELERPAYHEAQDKLIDFVYDGIDFWCQRDDATRAVSALEPVPEQGWRHMLSCPCASCRRARGYRPQPDERLNGLTA
jgi:hypothetical protein